MVRAKVAQRRALSAAPAGLDAALAALADPKRRAVIELLRAGPRAAGELAAALELTPPALSRHLRVLRASGLVAGDSAAHDARVRLYQLDMPAFEGLRGWLDALQADWQAQLQSFKAHAETMGRKR